MYTLKEHWQWEQQLFRSPSLTHPPLSICFRNLIILIKFASQCLKLKLLFGMYHMFTIAFDQRNLGYQFYDFHVCNEMGHSRSEQTPSVFVAWRNI